MSNKSSFATVAEQIASFNKNIVEILSKINSLSTTTDASVDVRVFNTNGVLSTYSLPSFTFMKSEITRLNNSINSLYSIDTVGALIQTSSQNKFKKIITVDLNKEPNPIESLPQLTKFSSSKNWIFDGLLNPMLSVEIDLSDKIENNIRKCLIRRYIIDFVKDENGDYSSLGQSALNSFNTLYRERTNIDIQELENWYKTTPGVINPLNPNYDQDTVDIEPNTVLYDGVFSLLEIEEDRLNKKLWYHLNTLDYMINNTLEIKQLVVNDEVILNQENSNTRYKVIEISTTESNPRVRFETIEGMQPIPVGIGTLKIYSPVLFTKKIKVSIGYNERNIIFIKPLNADNNIISKNWSKGTGFYTGDLSLSSTDSNNGKTLEQYYIEEVYDYGAVLQDLVSKKIPYQYGITPNIVTFQPESFKVVQINTHLTNSSDSSIIKNKHNYSISLKNEIKQIEESIEDRNKKLRVTKFASTAAKKKFELELTDLSNNKVAKNKLLASTIQDIVDLSRNVVNTEAKYRVRGVFNMPEPVSGIGTGVQEVIQFKIAYRYVSKDGKESQIDTFNIVEKNKQITAAFSNWNQYFTDVRERVYDAVTNTYTWVKEDLENADKPNINQIDLPLSTNERIEIRIKSISEVGFPESKIESDWSEILSIEFPSELNNILTDNNFITKSAEKEELRINILSDLASKGLDKHLSETAVLNNKTYLHTSSSILSGFNDASGVAIDLFEYISKLEQRIKTLEEKIQKVKGELEIVVLRTNQEFKIGYNSETEFNVECEEFLDPFIGDGIPSGRVFANNIYIIKDFAIKIKNKSIESQLGLLSKDLYADSEFYNTVSPQTFWVDPQDSLLFSDVTGVCKTQLDNQYIWNVNFESVQSNTISRLSENIGNNFITNNTNSLTNILSLDEYNIGYTEGSPINFISNNNSLLDNNKWVDSVISVGSTTKFLTTIHPVINNLSNIVETNQDKIKTLDGGEELIIPINIYFKMNSLNNTQTGLNYEYVNLNNAIKTVKHKKKLKFLLQDEGQNRSFKFTLIFNLNRNKVTFTSQTKKYNTVIK